MSRGAIDRLSAALRDRYAIEGELGHGGMATVYLARDLRHDRKVALKVLDPGLAAAVGAERFLAEIKLTASLQHPHILPLHDSGESDGMLYYVMPFAEGESLRDRLEREKQLPVEEALSITRAVASALDFAHRHGIVHRDIKPDNILLVDGEAVVADFGIALAMNAAETTRLTEQGVSLGTTGYMSPEQATGEPVDRRTDVYSLACVLYEMLAGQPPYTGSSMHAYVARLLTEPPVHPRHLRDSISEDLDRILMKALAKVPADRFQTAEAFSRALTSATTQRTPAARNQAAWIAAAVAAIIGVVAGSYALLSGPAPTPPPVREERQLTFEGVVQEAAISPQGDFFAYVAVDGGFYRLFVREIGSSSAVLLDSLGALMCCATWSPDGSEIAYQRGTRSQGTTVITPRLGGSRRTVRAEVALAWSPDATQLLSWWPAAKELTLTDIASSSIVDSIPLGDEHDWVAGADWSPDGERIVVAIQGSETFRIRSIDREGRLIEELVTDTTGVSSPVWSGDGSAIYYLRDEGVWTIEVTPGGERRGEPRLVLDGVSASVLSTTIAAFSITVDGSRLLYNRFSGYSNLWAFSDWDASGGEPVIREPMTRGTANFEYPRLSPNGALLAYVEQVGDAREVFTMPASGGARRQLTFFGGVAWSPAWSPDGSTLAFGATVQGETALFLLDVGSGEVSRAPLGAFDGDEIVWTPDNEIVYQSGEHTRIVVIDPSVWQGRVLWETRPGTWFYDLRVAPGGGLLARRTGTSSGLWRLDLMSGALSQLVDAPTAAIGTEPGGGILTMSIDSRLNTRREIYSMSPLDGSITPYLTLPLGQGVGSLNVTVSPDARFLIASVPVSSTDAWLIENFDPR